MSFIGKALGAIGSTIFGGGGSEVTIVQQPPQARQPLPEELDLLRQQVEIGRAQVESITRAADLQALQTQAALAALPAQISAIESQAAAQQAALQGFSQLLPVQISALEQQAAAQSRALSSFEQQQAAATAAINRQISLQEAAFAQAAEQSRQAFSLQTQVASQQADFLNEQLAIARRLEPSLRAEIEAAAASREEATAIAALVRERIERGTRATPEQLEQIRIATGQAAEAAESDITRFQERATETLRTELAPALGLRPSDSPIVDRAARIAEEAQRQQGQLRRNLAEAEATAILNFPLAEAQVTGAQALQAQALNQAAAEFGAGLREAAFANRVRLAGTANEFVSAIGGQGVGLAGVQAAALGPGASIAGTSGQLANQLLGGGFSPLQFGTGGLLAGATGSGFTGGLLSNVSQLGLGLAGIGPAGSLPFLPTLSGGATQQTVSTPSGPALLGGIGNLLTGIGGLIR